MGNRAMLGALALAAAVLLAGCGGDDPEEPASDDLTPEVEAAPEAGGGEALAAALEEWAGAVRDLGFSVTYREGTVDTGGLTDLVLGSPDGTRWTSATATIVGVDGGVLALRPEGDQELILQVGDPVVLPVLSSNVQIAVDETGAMVFQFDDATLESSTIASLTVRATADEIDIEATDMVLAEGEGGPLGSTIASIGGVVTRTSEEAGRALTFASLELRWGLFGFTGNGTLTVNENGAWSGLLEGVVPDALAVLDAFRAYEALDREVLAEVYAALLEEMATTEESLTLAVRIDDGSIVLLGEARGLPDLNLGSNIPVLAGAGQQSRQEP